jgi:hypothetical protein
LSELKGLRIFPKFGFFEHGNGRVSLLKSSGLFDRPIEQPATIQRKSYDVALIHKNNKLICCCHVAAVAAAVVVVVCV